jgi:Holliday junction resolvase
VSGARHRRKGDRVERGVVRALQDHGLDAQRVPLSGAAGGRFGGDVSVRLLGRDRRVEVKARSGGFRRLYDWLGDHDFLIVKADRRKPLAILPLDLATEIAAVAERARGQTS